MVKNDMKKLLQNVASNLMSNAHVIKKVWLRACWGDRKYKPVDRLHKHAPGTRGVQTISQHWMYTSRKAEVPEMDFHF